MLDQPISTASRVPHHSTITASKVPEQSITTACRVPEQSRTTSRIPDQYTITANRVPEQSRTTARRVPEQPAGTTANRATEQSRTTISMVPEQSRTTTNMVPKQPRTALSRMPAQFGTTTNRVPEQPRTTTSRVLEHSRTTTNMVPEQPRTTAGRVSEQPRTTTNMVPKQPVTTATSNNIPEQPITTTSMVPEQPIGITTNRVPQQLRSSVNQVPEQTMTSAIRVPEKVAKTTNMIPDQHMITSASGKSLEMLNSNRNVYLVLSSFSATREPVHQLIFQGSREPGLMMDINTVKTSASGEIATVAEHKSVVSPTESVSMEQTCLTNTEPAGILCDLELMEGLKAEWFDDIISTDDLLATSISIYHDRVDPVRVQYLTMQRSPLDPLKVKHLTSPRSLLDPLKVKNLTLQRSPDALQDKTNLFHLTPQKQNTAVSYKPILTFKSSPQTRCKHSRNNPRYNYSPNHRCDGLVGIKTKAISCDQENIQPYSRTVSNDGPCSPGTIGGIVPSPRTVLQGDRIHSPRTVQQGENIQCSEQVQQRKRNQSSRILKPTSLHAKEVNETVLRSKVGSVPTAVKTTQSSLIISPLAVRMRIPRVSVGLATSVPQIISPFRGQSSFRTPSNIPGPRPSTSNALGLRMHCIAPGFRTPVNASGFKTTMNATVTLRTPFSCNTSPLNVTSTMKQTPPVCHCGCRCKRKFVQTPGPNIGRTFFVCGKNSHMAKSCCQFFKWESESSDATRATPNISRQSVSYVLPPVKSLPTLHLDSIN